MRARRPTQAPRPRAAWERPSGDKADFSIKPHRRPPLRNYAGYRETPDYTATLIRQLRALAKRIAGEDPESLLLIRAVEAELKQTWLDTNGLRRSGYSDRDVTRALGISQPAVTQRWPRAAEDPLDLGDKEPGL